MGALMNLDGLFDEWERAWSGREPGAFEAVCDPGIHYEDPLTEAPLVGVHALTGHARQLWAAFPDARVNATGARLASGDFVAAPCRVLGTHEGQLGRLAPTHRTLDAHAIARVREEAFPDPRDADELHDALLGEAFAEHD